jgi:competence protein ComEA
VIALAAAAAVARSAHSTPVALPSTPLGVPTGAAFVEKTIESSGSLVYVAGEVLHPGLYRLPSTARAEAALHAAGGPTRRADLVALNRAEPLHDGEEIVVVPRGTYDAASDAQTADSSADGSASAPRKHTSRHGHHHRRTRKHKLPSAPIDLNAADETQLETLPGIGPGLAQRILAYRELNGPFTAVDDLLDVGGMTERKFQRLAPYVILVGSRPSRATPALALPARRT